MNPIQITTDVIKSLTDSGLLQSPAAYQEKKLDLEAKAQERAHELEKMKVQAELEEKKAERMSEVLWKPIAPHLGRALESLTGIAVKEGGGGGLPAPRAPPRAGA